MVPVSQVPANVRGWCPSAFDPMLSGDGWLVRARVGCRPVTPDQWAMVGELAARLGNGLVEVTSRGNLQIRGVAEHATRAVALGLIECGLASAAEAADRRRLVVVNPLARTAPVGVPAGARARTPSAAAAGAEASSGSIATDGDVVAGVEDVFEHLGERLPAKWWAIVDANAPWPMPLASCDVAVSRHPDGWQVIVAGRIVRRIGNPVPVVRAVAERCALGRLRAADLALDDLESASVDPDPRTVSRAVEASRPDPDLPRSVEADTRTVSRAVEASRPDPNLPRSVEADTRTVWWGRRSFGNLVAVHVAPAFGVMRADDAQLLATLSGAPVDLRPTPQRGVLLLAPHDLAPRLGEVADTLAARGWIVTDDDPRRLWSACIGTRGCDAALVDTWAVATQLLPTAPHIPTHVSGCPKRCGAPQGIRQLVATGDGCVEVVP